MTLKEQQKKRLYFVCNYVLHLFFLLKKSDSVVQPFLEEQQIRCVRFQSGPAGFPLGLNLHLCRETTKSMRWLWKRAQTCCYDIRKEKHCRALYYF